MRHFACRISICVLLGVITTLSVTLACLWRLERQVNAKALANPNGFSVRPVFGRADGQPGFQFWWSGSAYESLGAIRLYEMYEDYSNDPGVWVLEDEGAVPSWSLPRPAETGTRVQSAAGLPFRAVRIVQESFDESMDAGSAPAVYQSIHIGLLADTAIFASAWALLLFAPGAVIRQRRRRRGCCVKCGYDLQGLSPEAVCPECGVQR